MHRWAIALGLIPFAAAFAGGLWNRDEALGALDFPAERIAAQDEQHVSAELVSELSSIEPGTTAWVGVRFTIEPGWHMYWNGRNDTGFAPKFTPTLPKGFSIGDWVWPAPVRHVSPGDILDHVYEGSALIITPVTVPADAKPGETVSLSIDISWLVCDSERCVPESGRVELKVPVAAKAVKGAEAKAFEEVRTRVPKEWPTDSKEFAASMAQDKEGRSATFRVTGATRIEFYPSLAGADATDLLSSGIIDGDSLTLAVRGEGTLQGVLGVARSGNVPTEFYTVSVGVPVGDSAKPAADDSSKGGSKGGAK